MPYVITDFGGLNSKSSPFSLQKNEATVAENLRLSEEQGAITKRDSTTVYGTADATEPILGMHRIYLISGTKTLIVNHGDEIEKGNDSTGVFTNILSVASSDRRWQWLTWHNIAIGTDGYNQPVKYDGSSAAATYLGSALAVDAGSGAGPNGTYTYKVTCYTASTEYSLGAASNSVVVVDNDITLTMIPICPDTILGVTVTGRKIYRIETGGSTYKILTNGTIANNTALTLTDSDADAALGATLSPTATYTPPKGKLSAVHSNRLWIANNPDAPSRVYYSEDASHDFFFPDSYFDIRESDGDEVTCLKNVLGLLTVCKNNTIQKLYTDGDDPSADWEISDPFSFIGNHAMYSAVNTPVGLIYLGNNGIYNFNGQYSLLLSDPVTPEIRDIISSNFANVWADYYKNLYWMTYTSLESGASTNNRILIYDLLSKAYSIDLFSANVFHVFRGGTDIEALFSGSSEDGTVYAHTETANEVVHKIHDDFTGTFDDMRYIPIRWGGVADDPVFEIAWTATLDSVTDAQWTGTIDSVTGIIDRPDTNGSYISQYLTVNASRLDKAYWNEVIPSGGGDVTLAFRSGATTTDTAAQIWSSEFTNPAGSDISDVTADTILQYRVSMSTSTITQTPNLVKENNFVVKLTFNTTGESDEATIPLQWESGWLDFGYPGMKKTLRKIYVFYEWPENTSGTLNLSFENNENSDTDAFAINLLTYPEDYTEYFANGAFVGENIKLNISETSTNSIKIRKLVIVFDLEPLV